MIQQKHVVFCDTSGCPATFATDHHADVATPEQVVAHAVNHDHWSTATTTSGEIRHYCSSCTQFARGRP